MSEFDAIRPYYDDEVRDVLARIVASRDLAQAASPLVMPNWLANSSVGHRLTRRVFRYKTRNLKTIRDCQNMLADLFETVIHRTMDRLSGSGLGRLSPNQHYLFISNHRDILMDSSLLNYLLHDAGHDTCRMAVGDNLLHNTLAADLMRLNKSFVVERSAAGIRAQYRALARTSRYMQYSLQQGISVWIAQRQGRAKDGFDRTDPALLKMLLLAYRDKSADQTPLQRLLALTPVVPVSVSYELDPCAKSKAHELAVIEQCGEYIKKPDEDLQSMVQGLMGYKGRVRIAFGEPITAANSLEDLTEQLDQAIVANTRLYPTHRYARALSEGLDTQDLVNYPTVRVLAKELASLSVAERPFLLQQYANIWRNRQDLGID
ncbi:MAG: 1-acyl-sn-glycerol-3-phosphate acyltransferase [Pseudomonadales bacterium]|nr:1-acyl-sn-glycerol-3-phosphate acyltransferase [Pseudomonadales bacterium]